MVKYSTVYLTIPKEKAARIICDNINDTYSTENDDNGLEVRQNSYGGVWVASLYNYGLPEAIIKSGSSSVEAGKIGTKMNYRTSQSWGNNGTRRAKRKASKARDTLEKYQI